MKKLILAVVSVAISFSLANAGQGEALSQLECAAGGGDLDVVFDGATPNGSNAVHVPAYEGLEDEGSRVEKEFKTPVMAVENSSIDKHLSDPDSKSLNSSKGGLNFFAALGGTLAVMGLATSLFGPVGILIGWLVFFPLLRILTLLT